MTDATDIDELKRHLQVQLTDGLLLVIGSGLSCAEGLPGIKQLADHLRVEVPKHIGSAEEADWNVLSELIANETLEPALAKRPPGPALSTIITAVTAAFVGERERRTVTEVFNGERTLRLTRLVKHLLKPDLGLPIVTTNYDRLVEIAVEEAGLGVDTMFVGDFAGTVNEKEALLSHCRDVKLIKGHARLLYRHRALVAKPHGSLDWYIRNGTPVRYAGDLPGATRLIIPPGSNKFRSGYDQPFDLQRERANKAIDKASRFLIIGYGFNDDHLETHLRPALVSGKPALVITRELTDTAQTLALAQPNITALDRACDDRTRVIRGGQVSELVGLALWDLHDFISEVLEP